METLTERKRSSGSPVAVPRWLLLHHLNDQGTDRDAPAADARTTAASCTSSGRSFSISFGLAAPPTISSFYCDWVGDAGRRRDDESSKDRGKSSKDRDRGKSSKDRPVARFFAAHEDCVLFEMLVPDTDERSFHRNKYTPDYFLYESGAARPPALSLLPGCYITMQFERRDKATRHIPTRSLSGRSLAFKNGTGILRHGAGAGEVLVAQLELGYDGNAPDGAELCVLRPGRGDWELRRLPVVRLDCGELPPQEWRTEFDAVVPVGRRFMCWVDYVNGVFTCDVVAESPRRIRHVPLPVPPPEPNFYDNERPHMSYCRNLAGAGAGAVRFVSVAPRCCCGRSGESTCAGSRFAFNLTTWTLALRTDDEPMRWVKDGVLDCDELWALPPYDGLPRVRLQCPIVSSDDPDVVCFRVFDYDADTKVWMVEVDTRRKKLLSVIHNGCSWPYCVEHMPAKLHW